MEQCAVSHSVPRRESAGSFNIVCEQKVGGGILRIDQLTAAARRLSESERSVDFRFEFINQSPAARWAPMLDPIPDLVLLVEPGLRGRASIGVSR